jgi:hypothetical protein
MLSKIVILKDEILSDYIDAKIKENKAFKNINVHSNLT